MKRVLFCLIFAALSFAANCTTGRGHVLKNIENKRNSIFLNGIWTEAQTVCNKYDIPTGLLLGLACLESNFGRCSLCQANKNFLGIKYEGELAKFENITACFEAWAKVFKSGCFDELEPRTVGGWVYTLVCVGYPLDCSNSAQFSKRLKRIINKYKLYLA